MAEKAVLKYKGHPLRRKDNLIWNKGCWMWSDGATYGDGDPIEGDGRMHDGLDLACPQGNPVHVTADGVVSFIDSDIFGYGNCIIVDHGYGYQTRYAHLSVIRTSENIRLNRGDVIGETGVSGRATGPHLHYEVILNGETVDPEDYINEKL